MESTAVTLPSGKKVTRMRGVFQNCEDVNLNKRLYPKSIWDNQLSEGSEFHTKMSSRLALGHIEHPEDGITRLPEVAITVVEARLATPEEITESASSNHPLKSGDIVGTLEILPTPQGQVLAALTEANIPWGVSSRGNGTIKESGEEYDIVDDDFVLETWDAVFSPSVARAIPSLVTESTTDLAGKVKLLESTWSPTPTPAAPLPPAVPPCPGPARQMRYESPVVAQAKRESAQAPLTTPTITETNHTTRKPMSKLPEFRKLKLQLSEMKLRPTDKLKSSDKVAIFEALDSIRVQAAALVQEDATLSPLAAKLYEDADAFSDNLDAGPPADGPPDGPPAPPAPDAPPAEGDSDSAEVVSTLQSASDLLRELAPEGDTAAEDAAAALDQLADRVADLDVDDMPAEADASKFTAESRRVISALQRRHRVMENQLNRMATASQALLEKHKKQMAESGKGKKLNGHTGEEWEQAAREVTAEYNTECLSLGRALVKKSDPALYEANKAQIEGFKNYKKFVAFVETAKRKAKAAGNVTEQNTPGAPVGKPLTESTPPTTPPTPSKPKVEPLAEAVHPAVASLRAQRNYAK